MLENLRKCERDQRNNRLGKLNAKKEYWEVLFISLHQNPWNAGFVFFVLCSFSQSWNQIFQSNPFGRDILEAD